METKHPLPPFGIRDKLGYLFGDFGNDFTFILSTTILSKFYTDVMGVEAAVIGTIMMAARFVDGFTDVTMGRICDRSRTTPAGKFRPWLLRMCVPVSLASFLMYQSGFASLPLGFKVGYLAVTYLLWGSFATRESISLMVPWHRLFLRNRATGNLSPRSGPWGACWPVR